jgi:hypothetical protein
MNTQTKVNNSEEIWAFFKKFSLLQATGIPAKRVPEEQTKVMAFYLNDALRLHCLGAQSEVQVLDYQGKVLAHGVSVAGQFSFKNKRSGVYQLVVRSNGKRIVQSIYIP